MFEILLAVGPGEPRALSAAETISSMPCADEAVHTTVLNVHQELESTDGDGGGVDSETWYDETDFPESATAARDHLVDAGVDVDMRREHGDPKVAIIDVANEIGADQIVMSGRRRSPTGKVLFGSVTQSVLLNADVPVTVSMTD